MAINLVEIYRLSCLHGPDSTYDMIIGRDFQFALKMDISFSTSSIIWNETAIPMRTGQQRSKEALIAYLDTQELKHLVSPKY
jgi:hypothetical protein